MSEHEDDRLFEPTINETFDPGGGGDAPAPPILIKEGWTLQQVEGRPRMWIHPENGQVYSEAMALHMIHNTEGRGW